jgi:hypothetical protein
MNKLTANPGWQKRRLEIMQRDNWTCQRCYNTEEQLEVHHLVYRGKTKYQDYLDCELITLCRSCHQRETDNLDKAIQYFNYQIRTSGMLSDEIMELASVKRKKANERVIK